MGCVGSGRVGGAVEVLMGTVLEKLLVAGCDEEDLEGSSSYME